MRVLVVLFVLAAPALANPKAAAVHDRQGKAYFEAKQYDAAIDEFKKSYALVAKSVMLFKIASAYYAKADYQNAIEFYGQYLQADPDGPLAKQALEFTTIAKKHLDDERAAREAAAAAAKKREDDERAAEAARVAAAELERKQLAAATHVKNAEAFAKAGAWTSAGDELRLAADASGDPAHLIAAGDAYRKQPDHAKARDAYRAYIDRAPQGERNEEARTKLAESSRALEDEAKRVAAVERPEVPDAPQLRKRRGWSSYGPRAAVGVSTGNGTNPYKPSHPSGGSVGNFTFEAGGFARFQLTTQIALRPEISIVSRTLALDGEQPSGDTVDNVMTVDRRGLAIALPIFFAVSKSGDGFRLGGGPFVELTPITDVDHDVQFTDPGDASMLEYGLFAAVEIDFGLVSLEARLLKGFNAVTSNIDDISLLAIVGGLAFGFEP